MRFDILTLFPHLIDAYSSESILKRAQEKKLVTIKAHNIRDYTTDRHHTVDDKPYGGGAGMVMMAEPILRAYERVTKTTKTRTKKRKVIVLSAKGKQFAQRMAYEWSRKYEHIVLVSGRYEGIDERVRTILKADEISIGPYVTTDGDVAAMVIVSAVTRLLPGAIRLESLAEESHWYETVRQELKAKASPVRADGVGLTASGSLEYPHYTRPEVILWKGKKYRVPTVLLFGDHKKIKAWRENQRQRQT